MNYIHTYKIKNIYFLSISAFALDRPQYPGQRKHYSNTQSPWHRTRTTKTRGVQKFERYSGSYLPGLTRGPYVGYPWNRGEGSADRVTIGTTIVDTRYIDGIKYNIRKQYPQNRIVNIKLTNTSNENLENLPSQTSNMTNKDVEARFKQYDETHTKILEFVKRNESKKFDLKKDGITLYPFPPSVNSYALTPVKYLKLKTKKKSEPGSEYDEVGVSVPSTYKNNDDNTTDNNKMLTISGLDLMAVLSQLRAENRNYSMQILV